MAFMILPGVFVLGLVIIPVGIWLRRRKLLAAHVSDEEINRFPKLDFNDAHLRNGAMIFLALTMGNAIIFATVTYLGVEFMESPRFCGTVCHTVMSPEYTAYQNSPHSRVMCVQCHIGPGASWFVKAKVDGLRQVVATTLNTFSRPIHSPIAHLRPARETCEQCHWPSKHIGDKLHAFVRYADDEANTPSYNAMLIKTGGGDLDTGRHGGIHWWHIYSDNKIRYIQGDERRLSISWVNATRAAMRLHAQGRDVCPRRDRGDWTWTASTATTGRPTSSSPARRSTSHGEHPLTKLPFFGAKRSRRGWQYPTQDGTEAVRPAAAFYGHTPRAEGAWKGADAGGRDLREGRLPGDEYELGDAPEPHRSPGPEHR
jgi:hypothetical protein